MHKGFAVSIAIVLLLASGTFAAMEQQQGFNIITSNAGALTGSGVGAVSSINLVPLANIQQTIDDSGNIQYVQSSIATLYQGASSSGMLGTYGFDQSALAIGSLQQGAPSYFTLGHQDQDIGTAFAQDVFSIGGLGSATAAQHFLGNTGQIMAAPYGVKVNFLLLGAGQFDGVGSHINSVISRGLSIDRTSRLR